MAKTPAFGKVLTGFNKSLSRFIPKKIANAGVRHFKQSFINGGFTNSTLVKWPKTQRGGTILVQSTNLKTSVKKLEANSKKVVVTAGNQNVNYAKIHNEGGTINKTVSIRSFTKKQFTRRRKGRPETVKSHQVGAHSRRMNLTIPKRQFMGNSKVLNAKIDIIISKELKKLEGWLK